MATKRKPKTKEQLLQDIKGNVEFQKRMQFVREHFYPALVRAGDSIEQTQQFLGGFNTMLMQEFLGFMQEKKFSELKLEEKIDDEAGKYKEVLDLFKDMTVYEAKDYIEGMRNEVALFLQDEQRNRPLSDLKVKWIDQL